MPFQLFNRNKPLRMALCLGLLFLLACQPGQAQARVGAIKEGDILLQHLSCGELCDAIESVTPGVKGMKFSHCGLVVREGDSLMALEAIGADVHLTPVRIFFQRSGDSTRIKNILVARLRAPYRHLLPEAIRFAKKKEGTPYDRDFLMDNGKYYCSELIYEAFRFSNHHRDFFHLAPMTFKRPGSSSFYPAWVRYYQQLHEPIPEGKPGINPGLISVSDKIEIISLNERPSAAIRPQ